MSTNIERAGSTRNITWITIIGVILLPVLIGGILIASLWNPTDRLGNVRAAIVNDDKAVELNGQLVPLGRQLTAGLVKGSKDVQSNVDWVISNDKDARDGLKSGEYEAVIHIPENFSKAATSTTTDAPERAKIQVTTAKDARVFDAALTNQIASIATTSMGSELSKTYLENVLLGFTSLNKQLGEASTGAEQLAGGASSAAGGAKDLASGASQLQDGTAQLSTGASSLSQGAGELASGVGQLNGGAGDLANGAKSLSDGSHQLAGGAGTLATGVDSAVSGLGQLSSGIRQQTQNPQLDQMFPELFLQAVSGAKTATGVIADTMPQLSPQLDTARDESATAVGAASGAAQAAATAATATGEAKKNADAAAADAGALSTSLGTLATECAASGASAEFCAKLQEATTSANTLSTSATAAASSAQTATDAAASAQTSIDGVAAPAGKAAQAAGTAAAINEKLAPAVTGAQKAASGVNDGVFGTPTQPGLKDAIPAAFRQSINQTAGAVDQAASQISPLASGASTLAASSQQLAQGTDGLAGGASSLHDGTSQLATGADGLAGGASQLADGVSQTATGAAGLASGAGQLSSGVNELSKGTSSLASGLDTAVEKIPSYTDGEARSLASVVSDPVGTDGAGADLFGGSAAPLLAIVALWFGGLASYIAMRARTKRTLSESRPSAALALRAFLPGAIIGAIQGVLLAIIVQIAAGYSASVFAAVLGISALIGVAFAAINQALVAVFGGFGRWVSAAIGVLFFATGVVSTTPAALTGVAGMLPTAPANSAFLGAITNAATAPGIAGLIIWTVLALVATTLAVARRRSTSAKALAALPA